MDIHTELKYHDCFRLAGFTEYTLKESPHVTCVEVTPPARPAAAKTKKGKKRKYTNDSEDEEKEPRLTGKAVKYTLCNCPRNFYSI